MSFTAHNICYYANSPEVQALEARFGAYLERLHGDDLIDMVTVLSAAMNAPNDFDGEFVELSDDLNIVLSSDCEDALRAIDDLDEDLASGLLVGLTSLLHKRRT